MHPSCNFTNVREPKLQKIKRVLRWVWFFGINTLVQGFSNWVARGNIWGQSKKFLVRAHKKLTITDAKFVSPAHSLLFKYLFEDQFRDSNYFAHFFIKKRLFSDVSMLPLLFSISRPFFGN